ncbi:replication protein RepA [Corynebacterium stationis]|uniref:replication protein RepA n=1 Tax=Corynebacterium stationis TaxID=1705 RepID=UPI00322065E1
MALPPEKLAQLKAAQKAAENQELEQSKEIINAQDIGYTSKLFVQALFPYRKTDEEKRVIETAQGRIVVYADGGLPYGKYPRLIMAYIITRAVENAGKLKAGKIDLEQAVRIPLGHSMNHFLQAIGVTGRGTGGATGNLANIREQLLRLADARVTVKEDDGVRARGKHTQIMDEWDLWFDARDPNQGSFIESYIKLTPQFFQHIVEAPIPIDLAVLRQLTKPRSMDIYIWLTVKQFWLSKNNRDSYLFTWDMMAQSFATKELITAIDRRNFRNEIKKAIHDVQAVWPNCGIEADLEGVTVTKTSPSVEKKPPRLQLD